MNRLIVALWVSLVWIMPTVAWAEESHGYSRGNAFIYYAAIAAILIYGINDTFRIKMLTWAAAIIIPVTFYLMLPVK
jgi:hypothetical protein